MQVDVCQGNASRLRIMIPPCPKCGATKTDPVPHDFKYDLAWMFGYRLQRCSRCRRARYFPRPRGNPHGSSPAGTEPQNKTKLAEERGKSGMAVASPVPNKDQVTAQLPERDVRHCPVCGSTEFHRTKRTTKERVLRAPPMARCENCGGRFPYPGHRENQPEPVKLVGTVAAGSTSARDRNTPSMASEINRPQEPKQVSPGDSSSGGIIRCPACGSTKHHRTQRTKLEHVLQRPPMARCEKCGKRFPYLRHHHESSGSVESGETVASIRHEGDEERGPRTTEESTPSKVEKQGTTADSSNRELSRCPFCGSTAYRRSRRSTLEHLLLRPKMARCSQCRKRFPFPER